ENDDIEGWQLGIQEVTPAYIGLAFIADCAILSAAFSITLKTCSVP
ncbi:hypothetical protein L195_g040422, partial [Trifolium pratense]